MTTATWRAELPYIKTVRPALVLNYSVEPEKKAQARFRGRLVATPEFDLSEYRCRAVIDWLVVTVTLARATQFQHVQRPILELSGVQPWVEAKDAGTGGTATIFQITFQEGRVATVAECLDVLRAVYRFVKVPSIDGIEVSVDFTPKVPSEVARHRMVGLLAHHLFPKVDIVVHPYDRPSFKWGRGRRKTSYLIGDRRRPSRNLDLLRWPLADLSAPVDATFYAGRQHGRAQWKVMDKILDRQNPATGTRLVLPGKEKRARVEVTLNQQELRALGIDTVESLGEFNFATLQGRYFQFMLPTFAVASENVPAGVVSYLESFRKQRFLTAGIAGLVMMDQVSGAWRLEQRKQAARAVRAAGKRVIAKRRRGGGETGSFVAYSELNGRISSALEKLSQRERLAANEGE